MRTVYVFFPTVMTVKEFVEKLSPLKGDFDLLEDKYIVDARSLMGIFVLNLSKPVLLRIERDSEETMEALKDFIVDEPSVNPV